MTHSVNLESKPVLRLHFDDLAHPGVAAFVTLIDCASVLPNAIENVLRCLYIPYGVGSIPKVRSVTLVLRPMGGVAYTTGIPLDDMHKEIHVSMDYLNRQSEPRRFREETIGVITHEMVHCFQHDSKGTAPGGLIEGIADFVRLKADLAPPHWKKTPEQRGKKWDEGYQKTAWFLEWLENVYGPGTVSRINASMIIEYDEDKFWMGLFKESIDDLWKQYERSWEHDEGNKPELGEVQKNEPQQSEKQERIQKEFQA